MVAPSTASAPAPAPAPAAAGGSSPRFSASTPDRNNVTESGQVAAQEIGTNTAQNNSNYMALLDQSTAQTLQIQTALLNHNLTVGPVMAAKSASEDAKKT
jgi:hypothetical protein